MVAGSVLDRLGPRLCVMGPSNSGKSTLAVAIAAARALPVVHLDRLRFLPGTAWRERDDPAFAALHDAAIAGERWIVEGNYTALLPQRLARATGLILLDVATGVGVLRYLRRTWLERTRHGTLDGARDHVRWAMLVHIAGATRANRRRYRLLFDDLALPKVLLADRRALAAFYQAEGLGRP